MALLSGHLFLFLFQKLLDTVISCKSIALFFSSVQWTEADYEESVTLSYSIVKTVVVKETRFISMPN